MFWILFITLSLPVGQPAAISYFSTQADCLQASKDLIDVIPTQCAEAHTREYDNATW